VSTADFVSRLMCKLTLNCIRMPFATLSDLVSLHINDVAYSVADLSKVR
jgi:hypothetical protein